MPLAILRAGGPLTAIEDTENIEDIEEAVEHPGSQLGRHGEPVGLAGGRSRAGTVPTAAAVPALLSVMQARRWPHLRVFSVACMLPARRATQLAVSDHCWQPVPSLGNLAAPWRPSALPPAARVALIQSEAFVCQDVSVAVLWRVTQPEEAEQAALAAEVVPGWCTTAQGCRFQPCLLPATKTAPLPTPRGRFYLMQHYICAIQGLGMVQAAASSQLAKPRRCLALPGAAQRAHSMPRGRPPNGQNASLHPSQARIAYYLLAVGCSGRLSPDRRPCESSTWRTHSLC
jgi:hypothetical protein